MDTTELLRSVESHIENAEKESSTARTHAMSRNGSCAYLTLGEVEAELDATLSELSRLTNILKAQPGNT